MPVVGGPKHTYLLVQGVQIDRPIHLAPGIDLSPVVSPPGPDLVLPNIKEPLDLHIVSLFLPWIESQLCVKGRGSKDVAVRAWNATWDVLLLGALFHCPTSCVLQSSAAIENFTLRSRISVMNHFLQGYSRREGRRLSEDQAIWLEQHFRHAQDLLRQHSFQTAVHCLATYRWHTIPRARFSLLWAGIESLFSVDSEIVFRVSLYVAKFLAPTDSPRQRQFFEQVKRLYKTRSQAVHGARIKGDAHAQVEETAELLRVLLTNCVEQRSLPILATLAP